MNLRYPTGCTDRGRWSEVCRIAPCDYEWGIFQLPTKQNSIEFGRHKGAKLWDSPPDDAYHLLLAYVVTQADAENGSVEQCRSLTQTAPSAHDLENLFQFFLEEGRHSWAMVHLLLEHFGADGIVESEELLHRMCGGSSRPRLMNSFNYLTEDWLAHFMWCFLADRAGRDQLGAVSHSAFKPLRESTSYMMLEEPMHIRFGIQGLERTILQSARMTLRRDCLDIFEDGAIPLPVIQRYMNFWISAVYDLFGNDQSLDASEMYQCGIRAPKSFGAWSQSAVLIDVWAGDRIRQVAVEPELAINAIMRRQFIEEITHTVEHWNRCLARLHLDYRLKIPHERFNRRIGVMRDAPVDPDGNLLLQRGAGRDDQFLPTASDLAQVRALMIRVLEPGRCASWIAPPLSGLKNLVEEVDEHR
jgi:benzoyl-CoA 2,3-dioxygenase component B